MIVVVTGLPASGKSTLGALLAPALALPLLDKDIFLEALFGTFPSAPRWELSRTADQHFQARALELQGAVLVSWWRHPLSPISSGTPVDWLSQLPGHRSRVRHPGHADTDRSELLERLPQQSSLGALELFPVVRVASSAPFDVSGIVHSIEQSAVQ